MVSGSTRTMREIGVVENLGVLFNPNSSNYARQATSGLPWAADNAAFTGFSVSAYERMLDTLERRDMDETLDRRACLFVTVPDVVGKSAATIALFWQWRSRLLRYRFPLAFVAQDGLTACATPWAAFEVLFIGGSTAWKLGIEAYTLCAYAKALGKHVHVGRVNSTKRARMFSDVADSIDGTATSMYGDIFIPKMLNAARLKPERRQPQRRLIW